MLFTHIYLSRNIKFTVSNAVITALRHRADLCQNVNTDDCPPPSSRIYFLLTMLLVPLFCIMIDCNVAWESLHYHRFTSTRGAQSLYLRKGITDLGPNLSSQDIFHALICHPGQIKHVKAKLCSCIAGACEMFIGLSARTFGPVVKIEDWQKANSLVFHDRFYNRCL